MDPYQKLKKIIKQLKSIRGRHTELVTLYIPSGYSIHDALNQIRQEQSTAENIKSKQVRKNVTGALERIIRHLQLYRQTPPNGLAVFCGNVSEKEGESDIQIWAIEPPEPINVKLYWCDQVFRLEPLEEMVKEKEIYGIICLDKNEADIALLKGKKIDVIAHMESIVPGKTRAGGQSAARFSRIREGLKHDWFKRVGEAANKAFESKEIIGILVSGPGPIKEEFLKGDYLHENIKKKIVGVVDTSYTGEPGVHETIERGQEYIKEASVTKEKNLLKEFFAELQKGGLVVYGKEQTLQALRQGAVETLLVSEDEPDVEKLEEECKSYGTKLEVISTETREGQQFKLLGGYGGFLRYKV